MIDDSPQYTESSAAPTEETKETSTENVPKPQDLQVEKDPSARFRGGGTSFKAKLIGVDEVSDSRGDKMCQDSILKLKAAVKASGQHKTKIVVNVSLEGLKIIDAMTAIVLHQHPVHKISFIARDLTDRRAFGYVFGDVGGKHEFFGIKTAKVAEHLVLALRDLFQVVYEMKKLEMEKIKIKAQAEEATTEDVYAVPNNKPLQQTSAQGNGNLFEIEAQLQNMNQISQIDAFNKPWPENAPMSPDTPGSPTNDMFGMNESSNMQNSRNDSYTNDLAALSMNAIQPVGSAGAKLTKDQILAGFGQDVPASNPYQQQPQQQIPGFFSPQQPVYSPPQQPMYRAPAPVAMANPFAAFAVAPQEQSAMGMFPPGPSPAIPSRPGAMRPPTTVLAQTGAAQNPFGDTLGSGNSGIGGLLAPVNSQPDLLNSQKVEKKPNDPFAGLVPDIGNKPPPTNKKDMFKNFQMAKPQPPPRSNDSLSANFDSYMRNSVGGVPVDEASNNSIQTIPKPAPRSASQDLFNSTPVVNKGNANVTTDPFAAFGSSSGGFDQAFNFDAQNQGNNSQPLFG